MSAATATLSAGWLAILGTLLGVVIERLMRLTGRVTCVASGWETTYFSIDEYENPMGPEPDRPEDVATAEYRFAIDLFNGKEVPVGLRDPRVELVPQHGDPIQSRPRDISTGRPSELFGTYYLTLDVLNLPPHQYVHKDLKGASTRTELPHWHPGTGTGWTSLPSFPSVRSSAARPTGRISPSRR